MRVPEVCRELGSAVTGEALKHTLWSRPSIRLFPQRFSAERMERYGKIRKAR